MLPSAGAAISWCCNQLVLQYEDMPAMLCELLLPRRCALQGSEQRLLQERYRWLLQQRDLLQEQLSSLGEDDADPQ